MAARSLFPLIAVLFATFAALPHPAWAQGGGSDSAADTDEEDDDDDEMPAPVVIKPGKRASHFGIKSKERFGLRHAVTQELSLEAFVRGEQLALNNPLAWRSSLVLGGVETAYRFGAATWLVTFESGHGFSRLYEHTSRTEYKLLNTLQYQIKLGGTAVSMQPRIQLGREWSNDPTLQRWKVQVKVPVFYQLSDTVFLIPVVPKLTYHRYTDRPDNRADITLNVSAGARWMITPTAFLQAEFGFENRWSNVHSAAFSRWLLVPEINLRVAF